MLFPEPIEALLRPWVPVLDVAVTVSESDSMTTIGVDVQGKRNPVTS